MSAVSDDFSAEQRAFFRLFEIKVPAGVGRDGAQRFMQAFLKDPARLARWRRHLESVAQMPIATAAMPRAAPWAALRPAELAAAPIKTSATEGLSFTGDGGEYFRIWVVNLVLSVVTLGIYSAWAKVRRLRYFYNHTQLAGSSFDYHGDPIAILKGRLLAAALIAALYFSGAGVFLVFLLATLVALPWLIRSAMRFRLRNSSWRSVRFSFHGRLGAAYFIFLLLFPLAAVIGLLWPSFRREFKAWQVGNSRFGRSNFAFSATTGDFWGVAFKIGLMAVPAFVLLGVVAVGIEPLVATVLGAAGDLVPPELLVKENLATLTLFAGFAMFFPFLLGVQQALTQNLAWNHTTLGPHRFASRLGILRMVGLHVTNTVLIILTLGLFTPWAKVRVARERIGALELLPAESLDEFVGEQSAAEAAGGDEIADSLDDVLDLDLSW